MNFTCLRNSRESELGLGCRVLDILTGLVAVFALGCADSGGPELKLSERVSGTTGVEAETVRITVVDPPEAGPPLPALNGLCYVAVEHTVRIRSINPALVQFDQLFDIVIPVTRRKEGIVLDLPALDPLLEGVRQSGARPLITLDFTPTALSSLPHLENSERRAVPPTSYEEWEQMVFDVADYVMRVRKTDVAYWSVWNEPDLGMFWDVDHPPYTRFAGAAQGSDIWTPGDVRTAATGKLNEAGRIIEYMKLYEATVRGVLRADPTARIGGPNTSGFNKRWIRIFLNQCFERDLPVAFLSWHYPGSRKQTMGQVDWIRDFCEKLGMSVPPFVITEWNADHGAGWSDWEETTASLSLIEGMASAGVEASFYYTYARLLSAGDTGLTPVGKAFSYLGRMTGRQLEISLPVGYEGISTVSADSSVHLLLWSEVPPAGPLTIQLSPRPFVHRSSTATLVSEGAQDLTVQTPVDDGKLTLNPAASGHSLVYIDFHQDGAP